MIDPRRIRALNKQNFIPGPIVYWMSRDQRVQNNWALLTAQALAIKYQQPLAVVFCLAPTFLDATLRQYDFMLKGLQEVEAELAKLNIPFFVLPGTPDQEIVNCAQKYHAGAVVTDFAPLRIQRNWKESAAQHLTVPLLEVDAHNIVPCWIASPKQEWAAYTFRPKIHKLLPIFLTEIPELKHHPTAWQGAHAPANWPQLYQTLTVNTNVQPVNWITPGEAAAHAELQKFLGTCHGSIQRIKCATHHDWRHKLDNYARDRNDPTLDGQSNLSPYLHFGQIAAQRVALEVTKKSTSSSAQAFLEELIVRRELSDNFCLYNKQYDSIKSFPAWAQETLTQHARDKRKYSYSQAEFEAAATHDDLWNAAQMHMVKTGKMHGFMRMYWAKKILEWTRSPQEALRIAIMLNDTYELDGRDPNGYAGIAWSIGGVHDRAWGQRPVFGKIRYMSYAGCKSKFDVRDYVKKSDAL